MANLICMIAGVRGKTLYVYDTKCVIRTEITAGSFLASNASDGEKTIFYIDATGIQFKASGISMGYLQIETASAMVNNQSSNFYSENTFTFEEGKNGVTNELMREVYKFIVDRTEGYKYGPCPGPLTAPPEEISCLLPR